MSMEHAAEPSDTELQAVLQEVTAVRAGVLAEAAAAEGLLSGVHAEQVASARNLLHYLALRRRDLRPLQSRLAALGLSSLGRAESHVLATLDAVLAALRRLAGSPWWPPHSEAPGVDFGGGERLLAAHADALLGPAPAGRSARIMVTMPGEAAGDDALVCDLLGAGMDCLRINCAHDDAGAWLAMVENLRRAERSLGRSCKVAMDLAGPKLRTGPLEPGPAVVKVRPRRDALGRVTTPARVWLTAESAPQPPPAPADACLPVPAAWLAALGVGERLKFTDARGAKRAFTVVDATAGGCRAEATRTAYVVPGTVLKRGRAASGGGDREAAVGELTAGEQALELQVGDLLALTRDLAPGRPATRDAAGAVLTPASIGCTLPAAFDGVRAGEPICFDDGKVGGVVEAVDAARVLVRVARTGPGGAKLRADKGVNLPESDLRLDATTAKDLDDLAFVARHADIVELSFANTARDVERLHEHLGRLGGRTPAVVLKVETRRGFENLPELLLAAMRSPCCGVMIARGDLAVEVGFERLAEAQEEILWVCEAAHVPVVWATQVLEGLAKAGTPSRAEVTDAAAGVRAECVMLNKGPHVRQAVRALDDILRRMQAHHCKNRSTLRELKIAHTLPVAAGE